jgi:hypothetical protein
MDWMESIRPAICSIRSEICFIEEHLTDDELTPDLK